MREIVWRPSRWDRKSHPQLPEQASVEGRVLACAHPSCPGELLYLFTILELPAEQILGIYGLRWRWKRTCGR